MNHSGSATISGNYQLDKSLDLLDRRASAHVYDRALLSVSADMGRTAHWGQRHSPAGTLHCGSGEKGPSRTLHSPRSVQPGDVTWPAASQVHLRHFTICLLFLFPTMMAWTLNPGLKQTVFPEVAFIQGFYHRHRKETVTGRYDRVKSA